MSRYKIDKTKLKTNRAAPEVLPVVSFYHDIERFKVVYHYNPQELWTFMLKDNSEYLRMIKEELALKIARQMINSECVEYATNYDSDNNLQELIATISVIKTH